MSGGGFPSACASASAGGLVVLAAANPFDRDQSKRSCIARASAISRRSVSPISVAGGLQAGCRRPSETGAERTKCLHLRLKRVVAHTGFEPVLPP